MDDQRVWYVGEGEQRVGPMTIEELREKLVDGSHGPDSLVWREGMGDWVRAAEVEELRGVFGATPPVPGNRSGGVRVAGEAAVSGDSTSNLFALLSYVSLLASSVVPLAFVFAIVVMCLRRDEFSLYHAKQSVTLLIVSFVAYIVCIPLIFVIIGIPLIFAVAIGSLVLQIIGIVNAARGEMTPLPMVGGWAESWWAGVQVKSDGA